MKTNKTIEQFMLILTYLLTLQSALWCWKFQILSCHVYKFIPYLKLDTLGIYLRIVTSFSCKSYTSNDKLDSNIQSWNPV